MSRRRHITDKAQSINFSGNLSFSEESFLTQDITSDVNDFDPIELKDQDGNIRIGVLRFNTTGGFQELTGIVPSSDLRGDILIIMNVGPSTLSLRSNNASSEPNGRFLFRANKNIQSNESLTIIYDVVDQRWRNLNEI